jgi:hypothetical protein
MELRGILSNQNSPEKSKVAGLTLPNFRTYYKAMVINSLWYWYMDKYNRPTELI